MISMIKVNPNIFHAYDIRGLYPQEIDTDAVYRIAWAYVRFLKENLKLQLPISVVLGQDMRGSSPFLAREAMRALQEQGIDVVDAGRVSTPAFYYAVAFRDHAGGIMVTASHNSKEYNGLKFCHRKAAPIGAGSGMEEIKSYALSAEESKPVAQSERGKLATFGSATQEYVRQDLSYLNIGQIKKLKIAADPGNAMGATYLDELFKQVPCEAIKMNWELNGNMPIHEANPIKPETLEQIRAVILNERADFGIAPDGDGDRLAFLDEQGNTIPPAIVVGLVAQELLKKNPGAKIGHDLRMSRVVREMVEAAGGVPVQTMVGHSLIKAFMPKENLLFSGEMSMHYYFRENYNFESPVFVAAQMLLLRSQSDKPFSEIWRPYQKYAQSGEISFTVKDKEAVLLKLEKKYADPSAGGRVNKLDGLKVDYNDWWFNARPSNTEPVLRLNLEAKDEEMMKEKLEEVKRVIES